MPQPRKIPLVEIVLAGLAGLLFLGLAAMGLSQIVRGDYTITAHICQRYGLHFTSAALASLAIGSICGTSCLVIVVHQWRQRIKCRG